MLGVLSGPEDQRALENELVLSLGFEQFGLIKELLKNRCGGRQGLQGAAARSWRAGVQARVRSAG